MAYTPNLADTKELLTKGGYKPASYAPQQAGIIKSFATGAGQGALDTIISAANAAIMGGNKINELLGGHAPVPSTFQHPDVASHLGVDTSAHPYIKSAGEIAGGSILPGGAYVKGMKLLPEASGLLKAIPRAISGASAGALTGENGQGSRIAPTIAGGALAPLGGLVKDVFTPSKKLAQGIVQRLIQNKSEGSLKYDDIFDKGGDLPIQPPQIDHSIIKRMSTIEKDPILKMLGSPTIRNAHEAKSDLGKYINKLQGWHAKAPSFGKAKIIENAQSLHDNLAKAIDDGFKDGGLPDLADAYHSASDFWSKNVIPYTNNESLQKLLADTNSPEFILKKMTGSSQKADAFAHAMGHENPELKQFANRDQLKKTLKKIGLLSVIFAGGAAGGGVAEHMKEAL